jgi:dephospho-CoA kinase
MTAQRPYIVGLTGGIGSGKSTVSALFAELGIEVIDADVVSRNLVAAGQPLLAQLLMLVGPTYQQHDGSLNRGKLRELLFSDANAKQAVEALMHPAIRSAILNQIEHSSAPWLLLVVPLLLENNAYSFVDRILVVDSDESLQISRTLQRDQRDAAEVQRIMRSQLPRSERLAKADDIIINNTDLAALRPQVQQCITLYDQLARRYHS